MSDKKAIDELLISYPCPIKWDNIKPDEKEWICSQCDKKVVNLSILPQKETEQFLSNNVESGEACIRVRIGLDGRVISDNCPAFLKPARNQYRRLEKVVAAGLLTVVTWIGTAWELVYAADPKFGTKGNDPVSKSIKSSTDCLKYKLQGDELGFLYAGRPAPNDIKNAIDLFFFGRTDDSIMKKFLDEISNTRTVDLNTLEKITNQLKERGDSLGYFQGKLLQYLILSKSPKGDIASISASDLECFRKDAIKFHLKRAEVYLNKGMKSDAGLDVNRAEIAAWHSTNLASDNVLPKDVKVWKKSERINKDEILRSKWIISKPDLLKMIELEKRFKEKNFDINAEELEEMVKNNESKKKGK